MLQDTFLGKQHNWACDSCVRYYLEGKVSKYVTKGSKTAVMDVIGFRLLGSPESRFISVGSRRALACSEADFSSQNADCA
jgi:hypothetical protein